MCVRRCVSMILTAKIIHNEQEEVWRLFACGAAASCSRMRKRSFEQKRH